MKMNQITNQRNADEVAGLYQDLEERLMANIVKHIRDYDQPIASDEWQLRKLAEIGRLNQENIRIIAQQAGISQTAVERLLQRMAEETVEQLEPGFQYLAHRGLIGEIPDPGKSKNVKQVTKAMQSQAKDTLNLCNTTMLYKARDAYQKLVQNITATSAEIAQKQDFIDVLNKNATAAIIGAESRQQAVRKCIREFNERGIPAFVDKRGREWTPEAYVSMAVRTTSSQVAAEVQMARCDDCGVDLVEVDSHSGARPKCARDQGKIFDRANKSTKYPHWNTSSYGEPDGLLGINCGHHIYPYIEGVSIRRYFPTEDLGANDKEYQQMQVQRALERSVRKQKRECMLYDQLGDEDAFQEAAVKLKAKEAQLKAYVDGNDKLLRRRDREQVVGFDKTISSKAIASNSKYQKARAGTVDESHIFQRNQQAAENWAKKHLGISKTNYASQSTEVVNRTNKVLKQVYREYPVLNGFVDEIEFRNIKAVAQASMEMKNGKLISKLTLSPALCQDTQKINDMIKQNVNSGFWTDKNGLYGIVKHEATHLSEYALTLKRYGVDKLTGTGDVKTAFNAIKSHEIAKEIRDKALNNCNVPDVDAIIKLKLCEYALVSPGEFLAEACSEYRPRKLAKEVQRLFREEMNR